MRVLFVGDGERDAVTIPRMAETLLGATVEADCERWARLHGHRRRGFGRKLLYALFQARDRHASGVIATVDADNERSRARLKKMQRARASHREHPGYLEFPIALGEAVPHGEAWLLDDPVAVRTALGLPGTSSIPSMKTTSNPKAVLGGLIKQSAATAEPILDVLERIARELDPKRCTHAKNTGFRAFAKDVHEEFSRLCD